MRCCGLGARCGCFVCGRIGVGKREAGLGEGERVRGGGEVGGRGERGQMGRG